MFLGPVDWVSSQKPIHVRQCPAFEKSVLELWCLATQGQHSSHETGVLTAFVVAS